MTAAPRQAVRDDVAPGPEPVPGAFRAPLYIAWELTHRCNARCIHCYSASGPDADLAGDLTTAEALGLIDQLADAGLLVLAFSGGEPLLRRDWRELAAHAVRRGLSLNIGTNGSTITPRTADEIAALGVTSVTVSLDGADATTHERFRRLPGLFDRTTRAVRLLSERGVRVVVSFTPTQENWRQNRAIVDLSVALGASAVNLSEYVPAGRGTLALALTPSELRELLTTWIALREDFRGVIDLIWHDCRVGMLVSDEERRKYVGCGAGRLLARILPDGAVTPCVFLPTVIGSLRETAFASLWSEAPLLAAFRDRSRISGNCGACEFLHSCGGCRAVAYAYSGGDPHAGDPHCWVTPTMDPTLTRLERGESLPV